MDSDTRATPEPPSDPDSARPPAPDAQPPEPEPADPEPTRQPPRLRRLRALSIADKIGLASLALAVLVSIGVPLGNYARNAWSGDSELTVSVAPLNDLCSSSWTLSKGNEAIKTSLSDATQQQFTQWSREGRLVRLDQAVAAISLYGAGNHAVQIRNMFFTVTRRAAPLRGERLAPPIGCGGGSPSPAAIAVNLDAIAVGRTVSLNTLRASPRQKAAQATADQYGVPLVLPRTLTNDDYYTFYVIGLTQHYDCSWKATLVWWDGGKQHQTTVDDNGADFRMTARAR